MADLVTCPKCGLSQSAMHAFCAHCDCSFATTGPAPAITEDLIAASAGVDTGEYMPPADSKSVPPAAGSPPGSPPPRKRRDGTPTGSGTPTDRETVAPPSSSSLDSVQDPASASTTMESEDSPAGPAWNMPGRTDSARSSSFPAPPRASGREKRSLSGRARPATTTPDAVPSLERTPTPPAAAAGPPPRTSHPGSRPGSELRGRPPGTLFASEGSLPPGDPLMAALVSGEALRADSFPDIDFGPSNPGAPLDSAPPVQQDFDAIPEPAAGAEPQGPRVVPPSRGRRSRSSIGHRSRPGGLLPDGPDPAAIASSPAAATEVRPTIEREPTSPNRRPAPAPEGRAESLPPAPRGTPAMRRSIPAVPRPPAPRAPAPPRTPTPPRATSAPGALPPPMELPQGGGPSVDPATVRRGVKIAALVAAVLVVCLAVLDVSAMIADVGALRAAMNANMHSDGLPTPDLPRMLDHAVQEMDLGDQLVSRWATLSAADDRFDVGVEVQHSVVGLPQRTRVSRDGDFVVSEHLKTLEFYLPEWELDPEGKLLLEQEKRRRERR